MSRHIILGITGASGMPIVSRLITLLLETQCRISLIYSKATEVVSREETDMPLTSDFEQTQVDICRYFNTTKDLLTVYDRQNWHAPIASGSSCASAMIICPASMGTISSIAHGASDNLLTRAADVIIKEKRTLILVPRESPLSTIHLENLLSLSRLGAVILPPMMTFYHHPSDISEMVDFIVSRILDHLHIPNNLISRWNNL